MQQFMFATGIENSCPTIEWGGKTIRQDEMAKTLHYQKWQEDFALLKQLEIQCVRYGPPYHSTHLGPARYDWSFADDTFGRLNDLDVIVVADLCHFGVPSWIGDFQNPDWPALFAEYAGAFARRYPWIRFYTPVNEIFIAATFSAQFGWWNERLHSDQAFVTALKHLCKANILAVGAVLHERPDAIFIQSESTQYFHAEGPDCVELARTFNEKRFLSSDLLFGHHVDDTMYEYLMDNGMGRDEYHWFLDHQVKSHRSPISTSRATVFRSCTPRPTRSAASIRWAGCGRSGRTSIGSSRTASRSSASPGTASRIRLTGTRACARTTATSTRSGSAISTATSARSGTRTNS